MALENHELAIYGAVGLYALKEFLVPMVKGSFGRNLQQVDEHTKKVDKLLEEHTKEISELKSTQKEQASSLSHGLGGIEGRLTALDTRIAEQGKSHDAKLTEALGNLATDFNRKLTNTLNSELERVVREVVREELDRVPAKKKR